jgi:hypothetical protein
MEEKDKGRVAEGEKPQLKPFVFVPAGFIVRATGTFTPPSEDKGVRRE